MVAMCATMFTACSKDDDTDPFDAGGEGVITMTVDGMNIDFEVGTAKVGEIITIDWGDGQTQEYKSVKVVDDEEIWHGIEAEHTYSQTSTHAIKVSGALTELDCGETELTSLDVSKCTALTVLDCSYSQLTSLDVSKCTALTYLSCGYNELTSLDVSKNTALVVLYCGATQLTSLDVSKCTALTALACYRNQLTSLDVSKNTALQEIECEGNEFTSTALNKIFTDLPKGKTWVDEDGYTRQSNISVGHNPGSDTCDKSIIENKGWKVSNW